MPGACTMSARRHSDALYDLEGHALSLIKRRKVHRDHEIMEIMEIMGSMGIIFFSCGLYIYISRCIYIYVYI